MGLIILVVPLLVYYVIIVPIIKKKLINKKITNKKLKTLAFILLLAFPVGDHIIGYGVYKILCYTNGGVKIYKTVTDEQEQRNYWINNMQLLAVSTPAEKYGIIKTRRYTNDFKSIEEVYTNFCRYKKLDCSKAIDYIEKNNLEVYKRAKSLNLKRNKNNNSSLAESSLKIEYVINKETKELEYGYINHCNDKYNILPQIDKKYNYSCKNTNEIIKKYNLKNVIKVTKSRYSFYNSTFDKSYNYNIIPFLEVTLATQMIKDYKTNEILAMNKEYAFGGGWYVNLVSPYPFGIGCSKDDLYDYHTIIIPNPYKNNK